MANPLLETHELPPFSAIKPEHVEPAIRQLIDENRAHRERLLDGLDQPTWDNFVAPLEAEEDRLEQAWSPVSHLNAVVNSEALREAYNASVALLTEYNTEVSQDRRLYEAFQAIARSTTS